jgi:hypothetical protein
VSIDPTLRFLVVLGCLSALACEAPKRPPRLPAGASARLQAGDTIRIAIEGNDPMLAETIALHPDGRGDTVCGLTVLAGKTPKDVGAEIAGCLVKEHMFASEPRIAIEIVRRGSPPVIVVGPSRKRREVVLREGMTIVQALVETLATPRLPERVTLRRRGGTYKIDVEAIAAAEVADEPIELADEILVETDLPLRPPRVAMVPISSLNEAVLPVSEREASCGELLLAEKRHEANGKAERHPDLVRVRRELETRCTDADKTAASLRVACLRAIEQRVARVREGYGPKHPTIRGLDASIAVCPSGGTPQAPAPDCPALRAERASLVAAGKGASHPALVAVEAQLEACP